MTVQEGDAPPTPAKFELGILLVHGIGTQRSGDVLAYWGDVLLKTIERATDQPPSGEHDRITATSSIMADRSGGAILSRVVPAVERAGPGDLQWEGTPRGNNPAPRGRSHRALATPRRLVGGRVSRSQLRRACVMERESIAMVSRHPHRGALLAVLLRRLGRGEDGCLCEGRCRTSLRASAGPVLVGLFVLVLILGLLPIPQVRTFILAVQSTLTGTVGDSFVFVESPIRSALMRTCILDGLERLKQLCKHTVIVAHSQGAAVVLDALGGLLEPGHEGEAQAASLLVPDALVTFGAGTNQLASLKVLAAGISKTLGPNPVFVGLWAVLGISWVVVLAVLEGASPRTDGGKHCMGHFFSSRFNDRRIDDHMVNTLSLSEMAAYRAYRNWYSDRRHACFGRFAIRVQPFWFSHSRCLLRLYS